MKSLLAAALATLILAQAPQTSRNKPEPEPEESFLEMILRITGISATPSTSKGPGEAPDNGDVWLGLASGLSRQRLTRSGGFSSPIFEPDGAGILALRSQELVRISANGDTEPQKLFDAPGVIRLIGFLLSSPRQVLVLTRGANGKDTPGLLDLDSRKVEPLPGPAAETARLVRWDRRYNMPGWSAYLEVTVRLERGAQRQPSWTDVYLQPEKSAAAVNVSRCNGDRCGQPALSPDGRQVVFIRSVS